MPIRFAAVPFSSWWRHRGEEPFLAAAVALAEDGREVLFDEVERSVIDVAVVGAGVDVVDRGPLGDAS